MNTLRKQFEKENNIPTDMVHVKYIEWLEAKVVSERRKAYKDGFMCCSRFFDIRFADMETLKKLIKEYEEET